jgi:hypothetical protein
MMQQIYELQPGTGFGRSGQILEEVRREGTATSGHAKEGGRNLESWTIRTISSRKMDNIVLVEAKVVTMSKAQFLVERIPLRVSPFEGRA